MMQRLIVLLMLLCAPLAQAADFQVYDSGSGLELAIDRDAIWREKDGVHFVNQERFAKQQHDKGYNVDFYIRRTEGLADCAKFQYVFLASYYFDQEGGHVWSAMYPLPRFRWTWQPVYQGSVAEKMLSLVCELGRSAPNKTINRP